MEETILFQGQQVTLFVHTGQNCRPFAEKAVDGIHVYVKGAYQEEEICRIIQAWYLAMAKQQTIRMVNHWAHKMNLQVNRVCIKDQKTRWGSCSSRGNLNFSWRLILAPPCILEYVVVHELCHFFEMNHSKRFWECVETYLPDYKEREHWLKANGWTLKR